MKLALFDLDGTLLQGDSDHAFGEHMVALGWADPDEFRRRNDVYYRQYLDGVLDIHDYIDFATSAWRFRDDAQIRHARQSFIERFALPSLRREALELVQRHRQAGDLVAIVTATNDFVTQPFAELFGVDTLIATELARDAHGRATGAIRGTPSFREGKIERVEQWLHSLGRRLREFECSVFYSDSTNDLPLLEAVSHPVATNPGPGLARIAQQRGWPILRLFEHTLHDQEAHPTPAGQV